MRKARRTAGRRRRLGWRWRHNPLRRRSDVQEAWAGVVTVLVLALVVPAVGLLVALGLRASVLDTAAAQALNRYPTTATLVADPRAAYPRTAPDAPADQVTARARWYAPDGSTRTGLPKLVPPRRIGATTEVWTDRRGRLVPAPVSAGQANARAVLAGTLAALATALLPLAARRVVRRRLDRTRMEDWQREWAIVGPQWTRGEV